MERSGATGEGLSAINCYMGMKWGWNTPEDFVTYVVNDMMGLAREDLVYDVGRHVDATVHMWEDWGLPIWKKPDGTYERIGRWQIPIHGESIKPIVAEGPRNALGPDNIYERVLITQLLTDSRDSNRIAGAIGFGVRDGKIYVFKARAVICTAGGASNVFRPKSTSEGLGRTWYSVFDTGSVYGLVIPTGAEMTQMEHRFVPSRFKDGYGPIGMWFQFFKARATNALGEDYTVTRADVLKEYEPYGTAVPTPTPLRNHQMFLDIMEGKGPIYIRTEEAIANLAQSDPTRLEEIKAEAWEDFLDMTISQALMWAAQNIAPEDTPSEIVLAEPYIMGSHSGEAGAWVSGPDDLNGEYRWGYNRMTTVQGLFAGGDGVGAAPHKFSSGSFTEGRLAAKAAVAYVRDNADAPRIDKLRGGADQEGYPPPPGDLLLPQEHVHKPGDQPQLHPAPAGPGEAAEDHGRVCGGHVGHVLDHRRRTQPGPGAAHHAPGGPGAPGSPGHPRADALLGAGAPGLGRRGPHTPPAPPQGDPLARVLLQAGLSEAGRRQLEGVRQLQAGPRDRAVGRVHASLPPTGLLTPRLYKLRQARLYCPQAPP